MKPTFEEWLTLQCYDNYTMTNKDFVDTFIIKYFKWLRSKKNIVGCEMRELKLSEYTRYHRQKIERMIYYLSA